MFRTKLIRCISLNSVVCVIGVLVFARPIGYRVLHRMGLANHFRVLELISVAKKAGKNRDHKKLRNSVFVWILLCSITRAILATVHSSVICIIALLHYNYLM